MSAVTRLHMPVGEIIDPELLEKQKEVVASLSDEGTRVAPDSPYTMMAALANTLTIDYANRKDWPGAYPMMSTFGKFEGEWLCRIP